MANLATFVKCALCMQPRYIFRNLRISRTRCLVLQCIFKQLLIRKSALHTEISFYNNVSIILYFENCSSKTSRLLFILFV